MRSRRRRRRRRGIAQSGHCINERAMTLRLSRRLHERLCAVESTRSDQRTSVCGLYHCQSDRRCRGVGQTVAAAAVKVCSTLTNKRYFDAVETPLASKLLHVVNASAMTHPTTSSRVHDRPVVSRRKSVAQRIARRSCTQVTGQSNARGPPIYVIRIRLRTTPPNFAAASSISRWTVDMRRRVARRFVVSRSTDYRTLLSTR